MQMKMEKKKRGAKTAMALALRSPSMIKDVVSVDNAPVDAILSTDFAKYVRGMKKVEEANVSSQKEADKIFSEFEEVCLSGFLVVYSSPLPTNALSQLHLFALTIARTHTHPQIHTKGSSTTNSKYIPLTPNHCPRDSPSSTENCRTMRVTKHQPRR